MLLILNPHTNPYFNIATEEYLLKNTNDDIFMLYRNEPSIIVGKHQNTFAEINYWYVKENNIHVVRRLSGGGTVFHDLGNINFTFILNGREGALVDFVKFTEPIVRTLNKMGVPATRSGRNDILIEGLKISGNAEHVYKNRTLHHGTLLFSSQLNILRNGLKVDSEKFTDKAVKSVRSKVTNISEYLPDISIEDFINNIQMGVLEMYTDTYSYNFGPSENNIINQLIQQKYGTWEWNFGYSPKFTAIKTGIIDNKNIEIVIEVEKGIISGIFPANHSEIPLSILQLPGNPYNDEVIKVKLKEYFQEGDLTKWLYLLF